MVFRVTDKDGERDATPEEEEALLFTRNVGSRKDEIDQLIAHGKEIGIIK